MEIDLKKYTIDELVELNNTISRMVTEYADGYRYICKVRSYGRIWRDNQIFNTYTLQNLCYEYNGDDGIVDVYSTNPDLTKITNYGALMYIKSEEDYEKWARYEYLKKYITQLEKELDEWDNRDNLPSIERPIFAPYVDRNELEISKKELAEYDMSFVPPQPYS